MRNFQFSILGLSKKITTWGVVFCFVFNLFPVALALDDVETKIADYCQTQLGARWKTLEYTPTEEEYKKSFAKIKEIYHKDINQLFASSIQKMLAVVDGEKDLKQICTESKITKKIATNVTTYEISQKTLCRLARYQAVLRAHQNYIVTQDLKNADIFDRVDQTTNLQTDLLEGLQLFTEEVETELEIAKNSLEKTLAAYDEMLILYPLHLRLRCITSDLLLFRAQLSKLVNVFFCLDRYIDAASDKLN